MNAVGRKELFWAENVVIGTEKNVDMAATAIEKFRLGSGKQTVT